MTTRIQRSFGLTFSMLVFCGLMLYLCSEAIGYTGFGKASGFFGGIAALVTALLAILGVLGAIFVAGRAQCPSCRETLSVLDLYSDIECGMCTRCKHFYRSQKKVLSLIEADTVASKPLFPAPLPSNPEWPKTCAVCQKKATRTVTVTVGTKAPESLPLSLRLAKLLGFDGSHINAGAPLARVPHCDEHEDGVEIEGGSVPRLKFRSLPYHQQFIALQKEQ